jgi:hypothetical protein
MIYILGDSFSYGLNFFFDNNKNRKKLLYSYHLAKKLNSEVKNLSVPGASNWRTARIIMNLPLTENDVVIIGWTETTRFEVPFKKSSTSHEEFIMTTEDLIDIEHNDIGKNDNFRMGTFIEDNGNFLTRRIHPALLGRLDTIKNLKFRNFVENYYLDFYEANWHDDMFSVIFAAIYYKLKNSKCKFRMFNTFSSPVKHDNDLYNIPEYMFGYKNTILNVLRPKNKNDLSYYSTSEHEKIAELIYDNLNRSENNDFQ